MYNVFLFDIFYLLYFGPICLLLSSLSKYLKYESCINNNNLCVNQYKGKNIHLLHIVLIQPKIKYMVSGNKTIDIINYKSFFSLYKINLTQFTIYNPINHYIMH